MKEFSFASYLQTEFGAPKVRGARDNIDTKPSQFPSFAPKCTPDGRYDTGIWNMFQVQRAAFFMGVLMQGEEVISECDIQNLARVQKSESLEEMAHYISQLTKECKSMLNRVLTKYVGEEASMLCKLFGVSLPTAQEILEKLYRNISREIHTQRFLMNEKLGESGAHTSISPIDVLNACKHNGRRVIEGTSGVVTVEAEIIIPGVSPHHHACPGENIAFDMEHASTVPLQFRGKKVEK